MSGIENDDPRAQELMDLGDSEQGIGIKATVDGYGPPAYPPGTPMTKLIEQPDPRQPPIAEDYPYGTKVDAGAQALVWALTASQHGTELIEMLTTKRVREDSGRVPTANEFLIEDRGITYHEKTFGVAERIAGMWALVASSQPFEDVMIDPESGE